MQPDAVRNRDFFNVVTCHGNFSISKLLLVASKFLMNLNRYT